MNKKLLKLILCATVTTAAFQVTPTLNTGAAEKDVFTYAIGGDTGNTLNPLTADDRFGLMTCHLLYSPAYRVKPNGDTEFILAESMEPSEDGLSYTMKLKKDLKWSDGESLNADDIVFTYDALNKQNENLFINGKPIKVEKLDDLTIKFTLPSVSASAYELLSAEVSIVPKHIFEGKKTFDINMLKDKVIGAGPYTLEEYKTGQYLKFKANPNYANGKANIDTLVYKVVEKPDTAALAMQNGEIDAWVAVPDLLDKFQDNDQFKIHNYSEGRVAYLRLNTAKDSMKDKKYREGILKAIDRKEIMEAAYNSDEFYKLGYSFLPVGNEYYTDKVEKWDYDINKAKELLKDGAKDLKICYVEEDSIQEKEALTIQAELKKVGISVELSGVNQAAYMKAAYDKNNKDYDMYLGGYVMGYDPDSFSMLFQTNKDNMIGFDNKKIDELFEKANGTLNKDERKKIYDEVQNEVSKEAIFYPFGSNLRTLVTSPRVENIKEAGLVPIYTFGDYAKLKLK